MESIFSEHIDKPLGLAAFALFLIFSFLTKHASKSQAKWVLPLFIAASVFCLFAGLILYFFSSITEWVATFGDCSPIISDIQGSEGTSIDVTCTKKDETD